MEFVGVRVIKADLDVFNKHLGYKGFRFCQVSMFRDGQWGGFIECPVIVHSPAFMRIMDRLREYASIYFIAIMDNHIIINFQ